MLAFFLISLLIERDKCTSVPALGFQNVVIERCLSSIAIYLLFVVTVCQMVFRKISLSKEYLFPESLKLGESHNGIMALESGDDLVYWFLREVKTWSYSFGEVKNTT